MPPLATYLGQRISEAVAVAHAGEAARTASGVGSTAWQEMRTSRLELLYEIALLKAFVEWENFLEASFYRYMCGFESQFGQASPVTGKFSSSLASAEASVLGGNAYVLWHNPTHVLKRSQKFMVICRHESVFASNLARLQDIAALRHRIAHGQDDARRKFDAAAMNFAGRRYPGSRAGRFLRDWDRSNAPAKRWIDVIAGELISLAGQIV